MSDGGGGETIYGDQADYHPPTVRVLSDIMRARRQERGLRRLEDLPNGTDRHFVPVAKMKRDRAIAAERRGTATWMMLHEEHAAAVYAETTPARIRAELVKLGEVVCGWIEAIDRAAAAEEKKDAVAE